MDEKAENCSIELATMAHYGTNGNSSEPNGIEMETEKKVPDSGSDSESSGKSDKPEKKRDQWDNPIQFILTLVGYAVGLGNVWRFSYLCAKNGGSAFLLPYLIMLFVLGIPLFYLELSLGQSVRRGPLKAWFKISPNLGGIGVAALVVNSYIVVYYNVIIAWVFFFLFNNFTKDLPYGVCFGYKVVGLSEEQIMEIVQNFSGRDDVASCFNASTEYFWYNSALGASESINQAESFNWKIFLCLLLAWIVVYLCLFRGIKSSGKVIYFTATFPYVILICLFFRAVTLPGAGEGLSFLFLPSDGWSSKLFSPQVWLEASTQIFFSLGLSIGALVALASYTKPKYNTLANSVIVCFTNSFTSIFASIIVFSIVGYRARVTDSDPSVVARGPGLAFVVFTEAILQFPVSPLWGFLFFVMLLTLGLDSQFATVEAIITVLYDVKKIRKHLRKEIFVGCICIFFFFVSFPFVLGNGVYLFQLFDQFAGSIPLLLVGFFEFIAVGWVCGVRRYILVVSLAATCAYPYHPYLVYFWTIMWKWVGPIVMFVIFISSVILEIVRPLTYTQYKDFREIPEDKQPPYPEWAQFIGAVIVLSSTLAIPVFLIVRLISLQNARDEGKKFILQQLEDAKWLIEKIKRCVHRRRGKWEPQVDEDDLIESSVPYQREPDNIDEIPATNIDEHKMN